MKVNFEIEDDFPCLVDPTLDPHAFYKSFLQAEELLENSPKQIRETSEERLAEITSFLYHGGDSSAALYRKRDDAAASLAGFWLSSVRRLAGWFAVANDLPKFVTLDKETLVELPRKFSNPYSLPELPSFLGKLGIVLIWEKALPSMKVDGAIFQMRTGHVVIALSLRYSRLDNFWFTLLHELAHAALHADQLEQPILDDLDITAESLIERQADKLASDSLIPRNEWRSCAARYSNSTDDILAFAKHLGIAPQCVAGRLQREQNRYDLFSKIINEFDVRKILNGN